MSTKDKYRPVLTASQIEHILHLAKTEQPISEPSMEVIGKLAPFAAKIANRSVQAAYTTKPAAASMIEQLGGEEPTMQQAAQQGSFTSSLEPVNTTSEGLAKEQYWEQCYIKYCLDPATCSLVEIEAAQEHKYLNDLMTTEELAAFEARMQ